MDIHWLGGVIHILIFIQKQNFIHWLMNMIEISVNLNWIFVMPMLIMLDLKQSTIYSFFSLSLLLIHSFRLEETRAELIDERAKSTGEKMFIEGELSNLRTR